MESRKPSTAYADVWSIIFTILAGIALFTNASDETVYSFVILAQVWAVGGWIVRRLS